MPQQAGSELFPFLIAAAASASFFGLAIGLAGAGRCFGKATVLLCRADAAGRWLYVPSSLNTLTASASLDAWSCRLSAAAAATGRELLSIELGSSAAVMCLAFSPDGRRIIGGRQNNAVSVWNAADPAELSVWQEAERQANLLREERRVTFETLRAKDPGAIKQWLVLAPIAFDHEGKDPVAALDQQPLPYEAGLQPRADQCFAVGKSELAWKAVRQDNSRLNFNELLGNETEHSVAYAVAYIHSETAQSNLMMRIGSDDQAKRWMTCSSYWIKLK